MKNKKTKKSSCEYSEQIQIPENTIKQLKKIEKQIRSLFVRKWNLLKNKVYYEDEYKEISREIRCLFMEWEKKIRELY